MDPKKVLVLMPTFNGEKYLDEQIESILQQRDINYRLVIMDDCSTDKTVTRLQSYSDRIELFKEQKNVGTTKTLLKMLQVYKDEDYVAFCDQDDIWNENHLSIGITKISDSPQSKKILYFTKYTFIDKHGIEIRERKSKRQISLSNSLVENPAIGCGIIINRKFMQYLIELELSEDIFLDHQMYFLASLIGEVLQGNQVTVKYRLHKSNQVGINNRFKLILNPKKIIDFKRNLKFRHKAFQELFEQVTAEIPEHNEKIVKTFLDSSNKKGPNRIKCALTSGFRRESRIDQLIYRILAIMGWL